MPPWKTSRRSKNSPTNLRTTMSRPRSRCKKSWVRIACQFMGDPHEPCCTDAKDAILRDQRRRGDELEETVLDYESTIGQFRELVLSLQRCAVRLEFPTLPRLDLAQRPRASSRTAASSASRIAKPDKPISSDAQPQHETAVDRHQDSGQDNRPRITSLGRSTGCRAP